MGFLNRLFGGGEKKKQQPKIGTGRLIEVSNSYGVGDGTPLIVERQPDLEKIFSNPEPQPPQQITDGNRSYWEGQNQRGIRIALAMAYMSHPDPKVRAVTIGFAKSIGGMGIAQMLVDLLADSSSDVSTTAAKTIWERGRYNNCEDEVDMLRDEIEGYESTLGPVKAKQALNLLVEYAPDEQARQAILELINQ